MDLTEQLQKHIQDVTDVARKLGCEGGFHVVILGAARGTALALSEVWG